MTRKARQNQRQKATKRRPTNRRAKVPKRANAQRKTRRKAAPARPPLRERVADFHTGSRAWVVERKHRFVQAGQLLMLGAAVGLTFVVGHYAERYARSSTAFEIREVLVDGNTRVDSIDVERVSRFVVGRNIFEVSPEDAQNHLLEHPWIKSAVVRRRLPSRIEITVEEHVPVALLDQGSLSLVSAAGDVFKQVGVDDPVDLPVITGVARRGPTESSAELSAAIGLFEEYRRAGLWRREPISEIHVAPDGGMNVYIGRDGVHVRLGKAPYRRKLRRLRRVLDRLHEERARPLYVYLDNQRRPDRVTVRLQ